MGLAGSVRTPETSRLSPGMARPGIGALLAAWQEHLVDGWRFLRPQKTTLPPFDNAVSIASGGSDLETRPLAGASAPARWMVVLDEASCLPLRFVLPLARASVLRSAVLARIDMENPFAPGEAVAFHVIRRSGPGLATVDVRYVPTHLWMTLTAKAESLGARIVATIAAEIDEPLHGPDGPTATGEAPALQGSRQLLLALSLPFLSALAMLMMLNSERASLADSAASAMATLRGGAAAEAEAKTLVERQRAAASLVTLIDGLAKGLPDGAWIDQLQVSRTDVQTTLFAPSSAETLTLFGRLPGLADASLSGTVSRDQSAGIERFRIEARRIDGAKP